jgi:cell shape-determining protein MreC
MIETKFKVWNEYCNKEVIKVPQCLMDSVKTSIFRTKQEIIEAKRIKEKNEQLKKENEELKEKNNLLEEHNNILFNIFKWQIEMFEKTETDEKGNHNAIVSHESMVKLKEMLINKGYSFEK